MKLIKVLFFLIVLSIPVIGIYAYFNNIEEKCIAEQIENGADVEYAKYLCED